VTDAPLARQDEEGRLEGVLRVVRVEQQAPQTLKTSGRAPVQQRLERRLVTLDANRSRSWLESADAACKRPVRPMSPATSVIVSPTALTLHRLLPPYTAPAALPFCFFRPCSEKVVERAASR